MTPLLPRAPAPIFRRRLCATLAGAVALLVVVADGGAQLLDEVTESPHGLRRLVVQQVFRFGSMEGPDAFTENAVIAPWVGGFVVAGKHEPGVLQRFDRGGRFLDAFARRGEGPGEQYAVSRIRVGAGDTLYVLDALRATVNRYDASGRFVDLIRVPMHVHDFVPLGGRQLVTMGLLRTRASAGYPLHLVNDSRLMSSFGADEPRLMPGAKEAWLFRQLAPGVIDGQVWSAHSRAYVIEAWDLQGNRTDRLTRTAPWFWEWDEILALTGSRPPYPMIRSIVQDADGLLWVMINVADENWRPLPRGYVRMERPVPRDQDNRLYDTIIEVIDPSRREVIAHGRFDPRFIRMHGEYLYSYEEDEIGVPIYTIWRVRIER
jgi:hypothetical protein